MGDWSERVAQPFDARGTVHHRGAGGVVTGSVGIDETVGKLRAMLAVSERHPTLAKRFLRGAR